MAPGVNFDAALLALVLEDIYEALHPDSPRNPFRTDRAIGLRKDGAVSLSVDALK